MSLVRASRDGSASEVEELGLMERTTARQQEDKGIDGMGGLLSHYHVLMG